MVRIYFLKRIAWALLILFLISIFTFVVMHLIPGGPFDSEYVHLTPEIRANMARKFNLDKPILHQYMTFLWNALHFEFGYSFQYRNTTCLEIIKRFWPVSLHLGGMAFGLSLILGISIGTLAAYKHNSWLDGLATTVSIGGIVVPDFVISVGLILLFTVIFKLFPSGGWGPPKTWVMPVLALTCGPTAIITRFVRSNMLDAISQDYVRTARSKGLSEARIFFVHILKNAFIPILTIMGPIFANFITGSFFIETIFRVPGIGRFFTISIFERDYPMIMATTLMWATIIVVVFLVTDVLYALIDPRIKFRKEFE